MRKPQNSVKCLAHDHEGNAIFSIDSYTRSGVSYACLVNHETGNCVCTCEHFQIRRRKGNPVIGDIDDFLCKHIIAVRSAYRRLFGLSKLGEAV